MSDEILKDFDSKIYYTVTKIRNDRKRTKINIIHKEVLTTPVFKDITKDPLQDRVDKLLKNETLLDKPNRDKNSLRINTDKINDQSINISSLSTHSPPAASLATPHFSPNSPSHKKLPSSLLELSPSNICGHSHNP